jgi:hypothetical protein
MEVKEGSVFLKTTEGKTVKIPVERLSKPDQEFLKVGASPFEEVPDTRSPAAARPSSIQPTVPSTPSIPNTTATSEPSEPTMPWDKELKIDWDDVNDLDRSFGGDWKLELPKQSDLDFTAKRATLAKKNNFHEDIRRMEINPIAKRAVLGYTVSFSVPKPLSRLALVDLPTGKAIHSNAVEGDMCPLAILNDGGTVLMHGTSDDRKGFETPDQIQLWRLDNKKIVRSKTWIPFPNESESWGKKTNGHVVQAIPLPNNKLLLLSGNGHLVCIDALSRKPHWHTRLSRSFAIDASIDRSMLAILDGGTVMMVDPQKGETRASIALDGKPHVAWPRIRWSPSGNRMLVTFTNDIRLLDLTKGEWTHQSTLVGPPVAPNALSYPHDDYALLENRLLLHIPSQIKVCEYQDAGRIQSLGSMSFIAMQAHESGLLVPAPIPHPAAEKTLDQAKSDPSVFLIHPGVQVSIKADGAGQHANDVAKHLKTAAQRAGFQVVSNAPILIVGTISGPKQEAVEYIARGAYIANVYTSDVKIRWKDKDVWSTSGTNVPGFLQTKRDQSIQEKLDELGKTPNLGIFESVAFPKMLQKPTDTASPHRTDALLVSKFTMSGLVDSK